jgi:glycosyltransferase involved in cell wall biosynthesis
VLIRISLLGSDDLEAIVESRFGAARMKILSGADVVVCPTREALRRCQAATVSARGHAPRCVVIPNGVDTTMFSPAVNDAERGQLRSAIGAESGRLVGVYVGMIHPRKAIEYLLQEWAAVHRAVGRTRLMLIGPRWIPGLNSRESKRYSEFLDDLVDRLDLSEVVLWTETPDVVPFLRASDAFVFASHEEGFPNALLEAMACGVAPFVVGRPWLPEGLVTDGVSGYVVSDGCGGMSERILYAWSTRDLRSTGDRAREAVCHAYSAATSAGAYQAVLSELLDAGDGAGIGNQRRGLATVAHGRSGVGSAPTD